MTKRNVTSGEGNQVAATAMVFENPEFGKIRTLTDSHGEPLFCGKDVCEALGYKRADNAIRQHVDKFDALKRCIKLSGRLRKDGIRTERRQQMLFINESGFYGLVFGSKLEAAKRFTHWVTAEVLPQIRKNGCYVLRQEIAEKEKVIDRQMRNIIALEDDVDRLMPKALYTDNVLDSVSCYTTTQIAKELGCTAQELNRSLCACHIQYYQSGQYLLYADYAHMGLAKSRTCYKARIQPVAGRNAVQMVAGDEQMCPVGRVYTHTYLVWTERGRKFIHDLAHRLWRLAEEQAF